MTFALLQVRANGFILCRNDDCYSPNMKLFHIKNGQMKNMTCIVLTFHVTFLKRQCLSIINVTVALYSSSCFRCRKLNQVWLNFEKWWLSFPKHQAIPHYDCYDDTFWWNTSCRVLFEKQTMWKQYQRDWKLYALKTWGH